MSNRESYRDWAQSVRSEARRNLMALRQERLARQQARRTSGAEAAATPATAAPKAQAEDLPLSVSRHTASLLDVAPQMPESPSPEEPPVMEDTATNSLCNVLPDALIEESAAASDAPPLTDQPLADQVTEPVADQDQAPDLNPVDEMPEDTTAAELSDPDHAPGHETEQHAEQTPESAITEHAPEETPPVEASPDAPAAEEAQTDTPETAPEEQTLDWQEETLRDSPLNALPGAGIGLVWLLHANGITSLSELAEADADTLRDGLGLVGRLVDLDAWISFAREASA